MMRHSAVLGVLGSAAAAPSLNEVWASPIEKFDAYELVFQKTYSTKEDRAKALLAFVDNDDLIMKHNAKNLPYYLGHNEFSDQTWNDFAASHLGLVVNSNRTKRVDETLDLSGPFAESLDWEARGAVTPVKDQAHCGSCWSFSTTGSVEGALQIATKHLISLSEQQLVSCDKGSDGCGGGSMDQALGWIETHPLCTEDEYPYTSGGGERGSCKSCTGVATITKFVDVNDETALMAAINKGPVSIAIEADKSPFQMYAGGILDNPACGKQLDHGVLLVGYGTDGGKDYWRIKNSWGKAWGEHGYIRFIRGQDQCGLADMAVYPTGAKMVGPAPPPGPSPPSPPSPPAPGPGGSHYEEPPCRSDEQAVRVQGLPGDFCAPDCTSSDCPTDVPAGVTAKPQCVLQAPGGAKSCALVCDPNGSECGAGTCQPIQGTGICTYGAGPGPAPSPAPGPAPGPSPGCDDYDPETCKSLISLESREEVCKEFALICQKSCGCCGASPETWCDKELTLQPLANSIVV